MQKLTAAELAVIGEIWRAEEEGVDFKDITMTYLTQKCNENQGKSWKAQTVSTFLAHLVKKEYLEMSRVGRHFYYKTLVGKKEVVNRIIKDMADTLYGGSLTALLEEIRLP